MLTIKQKAQLEFKRFCTYAIFLTVLFSIFNIYQRLLLADYTNKHIPYGYSIIEAVVMAKIILIGESLKAGERFTKMPLIIPVLHKTFVFFLLLIAFSFFEHIFTGLFESKRLVVIFYEFITRKLNIVLAKSVILLFVFFLFFTLLEISHVLGDKKLITLFFKRRSQLD